MLPSFRNRKTSNFNLVVDQSLLLFDINLIGIQNNDQGCRMSFYCKCVVGTTPNRAIPEKITL